MTERLTARTGNPYGKKHGDMDRILADLAAVEPLLRKAADHEIRTIIPLADVVAKVLSLAGFSPDGHAPGPHGPSTGQEDRNQSTSRIAADRRPEVGTRRSATSARFRPGGNGG
jgi:hypothetical protein